MSALSTQNEFNHALVPQGVESAATAAASKAKALVEARYVMAMRNPRNWDQVRQDLLKECRRPSFADNKSAFYVKPIGDGVEGLGIRFVEVALRCMRNVMVETEMVFEDNTKEVHQVTVSDLESNVPWSIGVNVPKTVERSRASSDGSYISVRKNSWGKDVYTVPAEGDDILNKRGALISKAVRTLGLRIIPGDLQDEAEAIIKQVRTDKAAQDPDAERKRILDAFAELGVKAVGLTEYLGHDIATCSPAEMVKLRGLYGAIRDGEATWASVLENKAQGGGDVNGASAGPAGAKPALSAEEFTKKSAGWKKAIEGGKAVNDVIATAETKNALTPEQKLEIASWAVKPAAEGATQ